MRTGRLRFGRLRGDWSLLRLEADAPLPDWVATASDFVSITRSRAELSIVCASTAAASNARREDGWALLALQGPFAFDAIGILAAFTTPLADAGIPVLAIGSFDTDYLLLKRDWLDAALAALAAAGHEYLGELD